MSSSRKRGTIVCIISFERGPPGEQEGQAGSILSHGFLDISIAPSIIHDYKTLNCDWGFR
jgi:hypothetical protein